MIQIVNADGSAEQQLIDKLKARAAAVNQDITKAVSAIMEDVRKRGYEAVKEYSLKFDKSEPYEIGQDKLDEAYQSCDPELVKAMEHAAHNIRDYNEKLISRGLEWQSPDGGVVGRIVRGLTRVGIYVPGGTAAYPSSVLMNAVPAKVAGVKEVIMVTPPTENLNTAVLAAARIAGVDRVIALGGAQAVAALTYGADWIPQVDKLVGPGNAFVAAAKRLAYGTLDIDMVAGPSEVLVIADRTANPKVVVADLLSQAEHDRLASAWLITDSAELANAVDQEMIRQTGYLSRSEIMEESVANFGAAIVCRDMKECAAIANQVAPEHLEIVTERPRDVLPMIRNAGAIFLGAWSPEPLGDYMAGPDHVLPTSGTARFFSPLSVEAFQKSISVIQFDEESLSSVQKKIVTFAKAEKLTAHANSIEVRFQ